MSNAELEMKMRFECMDWTGANSQDDVITVFSDDEGKWHRRVYFVMYKENDGDDVYVRSFVTAVFTVNDGESFDVSMDFGSCDKLDEFVDVVPTIVERIKRRK